MATPKSLPAATRQLERFAAIAGELALIEAVRAEALARANAEADRAAAPLLAERAGLEEALQAWWAEAGPALTGGERKTIELGGCMIGTRKDKPSLQVRGKAADVVAALVKLPWAKSLVKISATLDRRRIASLIGGPRTAELAELGLTLDLGAEGFVLERVAQEGVRG